MKGYSSYYMCEDVAQVREMHHLVLANLRGYNSTFEIINALAISQYRQYAIGYPPSIIELKNWHPECINKDYKYIMSLELTQSDIQLCQACQFGYRNWHEVIMKDRPINHVFEQAIDYMIEGKLIKLKYLLTTNPDLLTAQSAFQHKAGLLHYLAANGVETHRQITPYNAVEIARYLLQNGAAYEHQHNIYGGTCSVIDLILTSAHPREAGVSEDLITLMRSYNAE